MSPSTENLFDLNGRVALVTGGSGALGGAMAVGLADAGAHVAVLARTAGAVEKAAAALREGGGSAVGVTADVLDPDGLESVRAELLDRWGRIDILVNAAGGNVPGATLAPGESFFELPLDAFRDVFDLNLIGTLLPTRIFGERMAEAGRGSIINISSMAADRTITRVVGYSVAKAAVDNFTRWMAVEMARSHGDGIRVNAIAPGFFIGEQNRRLLLGDDGELTNRGQTITRNTPMGRFGEAAELAGTAVWLASDASRFVTGTVIPVDGGFSAFSGV